MCAICGWVNHKESIYDKQELFREMLEQMSCRGKDNTGYHFEDRIMIGHKRLAIIDVQNRKSAYVF